MPQLTALIKQSPWGPVSAPLTHIIDPVKKFLPNISHNETCIDKVRDRRHTGAVSSAAPFTNTNMPPELHGRAFRHPQGGVRTMTDAVWRAARACRAVVGWYGPCRGRSGLDNPDLATALAPPWRVMVSCGRVRPLAPVLDRSGVLRRGCPRCSCRSTRAVPAMGHRRDAAGRARDRLQRHRPERAAPGGRARQ